MEPPSWTPILHSVVMGRDLDAVATTPATPAKPTPTTTPKKAAPRKAPRIVNNAPKVQPKPDPAPKPTPAATDEPVLTRADLDALGWLVEQRRLNPHSLPPSGL